MFIKGFKKSSKGNENKQKLRDNSWPTKVDVRCLEVKALYFRIKLIALNGH